MPPLPHPFATVGIVFYAVAVPILEVSDSQGFNPVWAPHARLHEVWQLVADPLLGFYAALGFLTGIVGAWLYNLAAKRIGGIEVEVE